MEQIGIQQTLIKIDYLLNFVKILSVPKGRFYFIGNIMVNSLDNNKKSKNTKILVGAIIFLAFLFGWAFGHLDAQSQIKGYVPGISTDTNRPDFGLFWSAWDKITQNYDGTLDYNKLIYGAIDGMVKAAGDPYTMFLTPDQSKKFDEDLEGTISGIGAEVGVKNDRIIIIAPIDGSPAQKAGLKPQDVILKIDDSDTKGMDINTAVSKIRGEIGTKVKLTILRSDKESVYEITREKIDIKSVKWDVKANNIGYIEISRFDSNTASLMNDAINDLNGKNVRGIVIDLRNNPGGYLDAAVDVSSDFLKKGSVIVTEKKTTGTDKSRTYKSDGKGLSTDNNVPIVILVNEGSASASEIVAGALKDNNRATLLGEKTFGKGSVQSVENLGQGTSLHITVAHWYTPSGKNIGKEGITPDITVALTDADYTAGNDPQLDKALLEIESKIK